MLGLDPSLTAYGWALHDTDNGIVERGRFETKKKQFADEISRYMHLRESLKKVIQRLNPDAMGIEHPVYGASYSEGMYGLFLFSLEAIKTSKKDLVFWLPPTVKKFAKGILDRPKSWTMGKTDMCEAAKASSGLKRWNHNEADAYMVACLSSRFWLLERGLLSEEELTPYEKQLFLRIHTYQRGKRAGETRRFGALHKEGEQYFLWSSKKRKGSRHGTKKNR